MTDDPNAEASAEQELEFYELVRQAMVASDALNLESVISISSKLTREYPDRAEPYFVLGVVAMKLGDQGQAIAQLERAHSMDPDCKEYAEGLANLCMRVGRLADGVYYSKIATAGESNAFIASVMPGMLSDLAASMQDIRPSGHYVEAYRFFNVRSMASAFKECSAEISLNPKHFEAYILLGRITIELRKYAQALAAFQGALSIRPDDVTAQAFAARALALNGRFAEAAAAAERAMRNATKALDAEAFCVALDSYLVSPGADVQRARQAATDFETAFFADNQEIHDRETKETTEEMPRVGLVSNSFFRSSTAEHVRSWFSAPVKRAHWVGYQQSVVEDVFMTLIKRGAEDWREIYDIDSYTLAYTMAGEGLDVLVDLNALNGETCFTLAALRVCPMQVGAFSIAEPGLAPGITHVISDAVLAPADQKMLRGEQQLAIIDGSLFTQSVQTGLAQDTSLPAETRGYVTFGGVIDPLRLQPETAMLWAEVLAAVPRARLLLLAADEYASEVRDYVRELFAAAGVLGRIEFSFGPDGAEDTSFRRPSLDDGDADTATSGPAAAVESSVTVWSEVDIFLDATAISCENEIAQALWSGVPAVTLLGERRQARVGASMLMVAGRRSWVAESREEYISCAAGLAADIPALAKIRAELQAEIAQSALFDTGRTGDAVASMIGKMAGHARSNRAAKA